MPPKNHGSSSSTANGSSKGTPNTATPPTDPSKKPSSSAGSSNNNPATTTIEERKPTVSELIGGKSWTGKLPVNLLYEHTVVSSWSKPAYETRREGNDFTAIVRISVLNRKTNETETIAFRPPTEHRWPSAVEAKHAAATYTLHRVCNMKNTHMMLPPTHRKFWGELEEARKQEVKEGKAWRYEADPFAVKRERDRMVAKRQEEREKKESGSGGGSTPVSLQRGWDKVPVLDMGERRRIELEELIRRYHVWNPSGKEPGAGVKEYIIGKMVELGFRKAHAEEAVEWVKDTEEALEWLLIHVPEDDLPSRFLPVNYKAGISIGTTEDIGQDYAARRLHAAGYSLDLCKEALAANCGDESRAMEALMQMLVFGKQASPKGALEENLISFTDPEDVDGTWNEEQLSLEAIYGSERFSRPGPNVSKIILDLTINPSDLLPQRITIEVRKPTFYEGCKVYPNVIPTVSVISDGEPKLPAHVKLSIIRRAADYARTLEGDQMIFSVIDWLENEILQIVMSPGQLRDVATAVTGSDERRERPKSERQKKRRRPTRGMIDWNPGLKRSLELLKAHRQRLETSEQIKMLRARQNLPAWGLKDEIVDAVNSSQVVIISGETGSGKSTQSVQFILDDLLEQELGDVANIVCTQPRRISALGLADRVSEERCQVVGTEVGYSIRGESKHTQGVTKIAFVTTGVLLRRLQTGDTLDDVSHIVVDEVHERSLDTDFLLILLKRMISRRRDLRVILMSATLDADVFADYFGAGKVRRVNIAGRTYPVTDHYLDDVLKFTGFTGGGRLQPQGLLGMDTGGETEGMDSSIGSIIRGLGDRINYNLIASTVMFVDEQLGDQDGAILIFLPGTMEISRCLEAIRRIPAADAKYQALPLHASLPPSEQRRVFPRPSLGLRKVIAATNVAETSITIEDVVCVIDTGRVKETSYDTQNNVVKLQETWVSRAAAQQRCGRAGRVRPGDCYKLYTRAAEANKMPERPEPELKRVPLEQTCLGVKAMGIKDVRNFLSAAISPPAEVAVDTALQLLDKMGAVVDDELTALGKHMAMIPTDLRCSKLIVYGSLFGCLEPTIIIASILTSRSPFISRPEANSPRQRYTADNAGDLISDLRAFEDWSQRRRAHPFKVVKAWCEENFISDQTMLDIASNRSQYLDSLRDTGLLPLGNRVPEHFNTHTDNHTLLRALVAGAFTPQIARIQMPEQKFAASSAGALAVDPEARTIKYYTPDNGRVFLHPSSTLFAATAFPRSAGFMAYFAKMSTSKVFIRECTPVSAYGLLLLGGRVEVDTMGRGITVDGWVRLRGWGRVGVLVRRLRAMMDDALERMVDCPNGDGGAAAGRDEAVVRVVRRLIEGDGI